jgi:transposase-like protein
MKTKKGHIKSQKGQDLPDMSESQARDYLEKLRWPNGPVCIECGSDQVYKLNGESTRDGLMKCRGCKAQFSVTVGTIMEDSHLPLAKWVKAFHMMAASKKGVSALQLMRNLGIGSYKSAWHLAHRIRYAMSDPKQSMLKGQVQADECYIGGKYRCGSGEDRKSQYENKAPVVALVETNGNVHSHAVEHVNAATLRKALDESVDQSAMIISDEHGAYPLAANNFTGGHFTVNHSWKQYARTIFLNDGAETRITTNTAESYFSLLKRGVYGTFHHVSKKHLHRYCSEFDFRWNGRLLTDSERRTRALQQIEGKRLMYKQPVGEA